jgi:UDP-GlcNAc:undecaprenyl-phosphate/decaprenyl-phosphate GlcNAc-1-phosphate transferase
MPAGLTAFAAGAAAAFLLTPPVRRLAQRLQVLDRPDRRRKLHRRLVPLWGGLAIFPALVCGVAAAVFGSADGSLLPPDWRLGLLALAGGLLAGVGVADDNSGLPPKVKLLAHMLAAALAVAAGLRLEQVPLPGGRSLAIWPAAGALFAFLWLTFMTNAYNFIDGLDGLAAGQAVISGAGLALAAVFLGARGLPAADVRLAVILAAAAAGAALGFWRYNRPPARIFLGDAGSTLLGFTLALAALAATRRSVSPWAPLVPVCMLGWPIADACLAVARRASRREPISKADHRHLHHILLRRGYSPRAASVLILAAVFCLTLLGLAAARL